MMLWFLLAALTFGLVAVLIAPLRWAKNPSVQAQADYDLAVYRDQLAELERDVTRGAISGTDADAARAEISRRILAADAARAEAPAATRQLVWAKAATAIAIPLLAIGFYVAEGRPNLAGVPHADRLANAEKTGDFEALIAKVSAHLEENPSDLRGWQVMASALAGRGRYEEASQALAGLLRNTTPNADLLADYGETLVLANGGQMTEKAEAAFAEALKLNPDHPKSAFFQGLALRQKGQTAEALAVWQALFDKAPPDAPWRAAVRAAMDEVATAPAASAAPGMPQLSEEQIAAAKQMTPEDRQAMIRSMVDGLAEKLKLNGKDLDGWLRLANARKMLGDMPAAQKALDDAAEIYKDDQPALARIAAAREGLNP
jgi:cytochrome c-type biogenesis protein CcmH